MSDETETYRFAKAEDGQVTLETDPRLGLFAVCIAHQQSAGFGNYIDAREFNCPECGAPGFNTGWGVIRYTCGAEYHSDGTPAERCQENAA